MKIKRQIKKFTKFKENNIQYREEYFTYVINFEKNVNKRPQYKNCIVDRFTCNVTRK